MTQINLVYICLKHVKCMVEISLNCALHLWNKNNICTMCKKHEYYFLIFQAEIHRIKIFSDTI